MEKIHSYDSWGNRTGFLLKRNGVTELHLTYEYDKLNRLQWVMRPTNDPNLTQIIAEYRYNRGGSREKLIRYGGKQITTDYLYNAASLVTSLTNKRGEEVLSAYAYTYYPDGNQNSKTSTVRGERKTVYYEYDAMGRLTCEREDGGSRTDYTYDALSNRKQMKVTGAGRFDYTTTYDCDSLCRLLEERKVSADATETVSYQYDQNGNQTRRIWQRVGKKGTAPGGIHLSHGPADDNCMVEYRSYNAMGEMFDKETGTYYLRARAYDPRTSRMLSEDPIKEVLYEMPNGQIVADPLSLNLYTYCKNNPLRYKDATGMTPTESQIVEYYFKEYFNQYFRTIEDFYASFQNDVNKFLDTISFDVGTGYYAGEPTAYGKSLYAEASGLEFKNGINLINAEAGVSKIGGDYDFDSLGILKGAGWNLSALSAEAALGIGNEYTGVNAGARLISAGGEIKIPLLFSDKKIIIGVESEAFALGFQAGYNYETNRFKIGASALLGGNLIFGLQ